MTCKECKHCYFEDLDKILCCDISVHPIGFFDNEWLYKENLEICNKFEVTYANKKEEYKKRNNL